MLGRQDEPRSMLIRLVDDLWIFDETAREESARHVRSLPDDVVKDAVRAVVDVGGDHGRWPLAAHVATVGRLLREDPAAAAAAGSAIGTVLAERGLWVEAQEFAAAALAGVERLREQGGDGPSEAFWFAAMAVLVLVEWNTFGGEAAFEELSAALVRLRARNLLRRHHAPALIGLGRVLAARGEFGAAAVSIMRGTQLLPSTASPPRTAGWASLALVRYRQGDWHGARRASEIVREIADESADPFSRMLAAAVDTLEPALAGEFEVAGHRIGRAQHELSARPNVLGETILLNARIGLAIGANDWRGMVQLLAAAEEPGYRRAYTPHEWNALWAIALRNSGQIPRYRELLAGWAGLPGASGHPYYWAHAALLAQIDADRAAALAAARRARETLSDGEDPLGRGWTRIVVGTIVSLSGDPTEGMESYEAARAEFLELGADGFAALCTRIIQSTAAELAKATGDGLQALTTQQRRIAELIADGYTSAEIGEILYLSKKTIDFHAANIVSRLRLGNRREIKRFVAAARAPQAGPVSRVAPRGSR